MRLGYFCNTYPRATDTFIRREVIGLRARGMDVSTYSVRRAGDDHEVDPEVVSESERTDYLLPVRARDVGYLVRRALLSPLQFARVLTLALHTARPGLRGLLLQLAYFVEAVFLARRLEADRIDHLHNHLGDASGTVAMLASQLTGVPFSISIHGPHIFFDGFSWALDRKAELASFIACIGHFCVSQMMLYAGAQHFDKFHIVRCGIRPADFPFRPPAGEVRRLLFVGRLSSEKGLPFLFRALAALNREGHQLELELMGDGEERSALEALAVELGIAGQVRFSGFVDRDTIVRGLAASHLFILPSFAEGIPVALMEAMAIGVPVIATQVGGVSELVIDGETGRTVSPASAQALEGAILSYVGNPQFRADISRRARAKVETEFDIDAQVARLERLFLGAAAAAGNGP